MKRKFAITCLLLFGLAGSAHAEDFSGYVPITEMKTSATTFNVVVDGEFHGCGAGSGYEYRVYTDEPNYDAHTRALTAAFLSGKKVKLRWECNSSKLAAVSLVRVQ